MLRTSLRSVSGPIRCRICAPYLPAPPSQTRPRGYHSESTKEDGQPGNVVPPVVREEANAFREKLQLNSESNPSNSSTKNDSVSITNDQGQKAAGKGLITPKVDAGQTIESSNASHKAPSPLIKSPSAPLIKRHVAPVIKKTFPKPKISARSTAPQGKKSTWVSEHPPLPAVKRISGSLKKHDIDFKALDFQTASVPNLSFGLDRVLFNPGVYHLRDPRSRVYNFDPALGNIMPVTEFDFDLLKQYITSSKDETLIQLARETNKKYVGSSSSMTAVLSHFHYLLSQWRPLKQDTISRGFGENMTSFTKLLRGPSAMFLHYKDGVYAIDADKEFDSANILMNLGKSMEKQLTLPKEEFERYRRSSPNKITVEEENAQPEAYHYSTLGDFVMRSQLDAYDPRLPGSGMFDLKTRAVVSIRMSVKEYEHGLGYEIRNRFGDFESFEREYYDMIRAAFLKYSLQVRIGRMDGIFVAFHNIERIFGFQYVPLSEMDYALHGQTDPELGDQEFHYSIKLWNEILDRATAKYPKQSLRLHFETLEETPARMMIYVQPVTDEEIQAVQEKNKSAIERAQQQMLYPESVIPEDNSDAAEVVVEAVPGPGDVAISTDETIRLQDSGTETATSLSSEATIELSSQPQQQQHPQQENTDTATEPAEPNAAIDGIAEKLKASKYVLRSVTKGLSFIQRQREAARIRPTLFAMELNIQNIVNGRATNRPNHVTSRAAWKVAYTIKELEIGSRKVYHEFEAMRARRERALLFGARDEQSRFMQSLRRLSMEGKRFREEQDRIDREQGVVVFKELNPGSNK